MRKLLSAETYRCRHSLLFWLTLLASLLSGVFFGIITVSGSFDGVYSFEDVFIVPFFVILAAFISLNTGREYTDNTIRNKIITGTPKTTILLSKLVLAVGIGVLFCAAFLAPCAIILSFDVLSKIPASVLCLTVLGFVLLSIVWAVLFTIIGVLISAKGLGGIINIVLIIAILLLSYQLESILRQPEFITTTEFSQVQMTPEEVKQIQEGTYEGNYSLTTDENGQVTYYKTVFVDAEQIPNPKYIKQPFRGILTHLDAMLPNGQINEYASCLSHCTYPDEQAGDTSKNDPIDAYPRLKTFPLYSCFDILLLSGIGLLLFRKKEFR